MERSQKRGQHKTGLIKLLYIYQGSGPRHQIYKQDSARNSWVFCFSIEHFEEATKIAVKTVKRWLEYNDEGNLRVVFCCYSDRDVDVYVNRALAERIAPREENLLIPSIAFKSDNPRVMGCRTMPLECVAQKLKVKLEEHIFKNMRSSHISEDMNDHWDLLYENNKLYMYRSWTGICIFVAEIGDDGVVKQLLINQDSREYGGQVEESVDIALKLIKGYFKYDREYWRS